MRILDQEQTAINLDTIGLEQQDLDILKEAIARPQGMILVTGPTGSGKTTTLYSALNFINNEAKNIITIEDPIEYLLKGINQIQVNPIKDLTFANGLRSMLRQDPNVILVGEIRDRETADIAFRSSLTGHLVLSTVHTNDAVSTITRLLDIGLEPYLIASSLILIVAQRLVRVTCPSCKQEYTPEAGLVAKLKPYIDKFEIKKFYRGEGCEKCDFSGFFGRAGIFEMFKVNENIRSLISAKSSGELIVKEARNNGMRFLIESGVAKVSQGVTSLEELARVIDVGAGVDLSDKGHKSDRIKILIADDDKLIRMLVIGAFGAGADKFDFIEANNGREAAKLFHENKPDLLITDVMMPEMDGYELVKSLRSSLGTANFPIVMLTSMSDKESELKGIDAGADDYIAKPFDKERLVARVKMLLRRKVN